MRKVVCITTGKDWRRSLEPSRAAVTPRTPEYYAELAALKAGDVSGEETKSQKRARRKREYEEYKLKEKEGQAKLVPKTTEQTPEQLESMYGYYGPVDEPTG